MLLAFFGTVTIIGTACALICSPSSLSSNCMYGHGVAHSVLSITVCMKNPSD